MTKRTFRKIIGLILLAPGLVFAVFPSLLEAQERWGEVGIAGMVLKEIPPGADTWPGLVLGLGAWRKTVSFEAFLASGGTWWFIPAFLGGSVIVTPFRATGVVPYISAGAMIYLWGSGFSPHAGIGLKLPLGRHSGLRTDLRIFRYDHETWAAITFGAYLGFGVKRR